MITAVIPRGWLFSAAATTALLLCLAHGYIPVLALVAPVPLLWALRHATTRLAFYLGLVSGIGEAFVLTGVWHASIQLVIVLCLMYGLFRALFTVVVTHVAPRPGMILPSVAAAVWSLCEWLQSLLPLTLPNLLGDTQHEGPLLPLARVGGTYLISFQLVWLAALLAESADALWRGRWRVYFDRGRQAEVTLALLVTSAFGVIAARTAPIQVGALQVAIVQGGLPTWVYTEAETDPAWERLPEQVYTTMTHDAPTAALTVWPETAVWRYFGADPPWEHSLAALAKERGALLIGSPRRDSAKTLYNSAVLLDPNGVQTADKRRLALRAEAAFTPGIVPSLLTLHPGDGSAPVPLGIIFCLESVVPQYARELVLGGSRALVVLAEGSRFGDTPVGRLHAQRSVVRAVEAGRSVVHAGQQGYSSIIDATGSHTPPLTPFGAAFVGDALPLYEGLTPFVRFGAWPVGPWLVILLAAYAWRIRLARTRRKAANSAP